MIWIKKLDSYLPWFCLDTAMQVKQKENAELFGSVIYIFNHTVLQSRWTPHTVKPSFKPVSFGWNFFATILIWSEPHWLIIFLSVENLIKTKWGVRNIMKFYLVNLCIYLFIFATFLGLLITLLFYHVSSKPQISLSPFQVVEFPVSKSS